MFNRYQLIIKRSIERITSKTNQKKSIRELTLYLQFHKFLLGYGNYCTFWKNNSVKRRFVTTSVDTFKVIFSYIQINETFSAILG